MKTLITGATGFIGKSLVRTLLEKNRALRCLVRGKSNVEELKKQGVEIICGDLLDTNSLKEAVKGVNIVYHLAGEVYAKRCDDFFKTNVEGTRNLLDTCLSENIEKIVHLSSIAAVGPNPDRNTLLTEETPCKPITTYGKSKYEGEQLALSYFEKFGLPIVCVRPPTVYGPGQSEVLDSFFKNIYRKRIVVVGDGDCLRSLCYIDNLIKGLILTEVDGKTGGKVFFIADEKVCTFNQILQTIAREERVEFNERHVGQWFGKLSLATFVLLERMNISLMPLYAVGTMVINLGCDISKARNDLGYHPHIDLEEGIRRTIHSLNLH